MKQARFLLSRSVIRWFKSLGAGRDRKEQGLVERGGWFVSAACVVGLLLPVTVRGAILDQGSIHAWGMSGRDAAVGNGSIITEASLTVEGLRCSEGAGRLSIHMVDEPALGYQTSAARPYGEPLFVVAGQESPSDVVLPWNSVDDKDSWIWDRFQRPFVFSLRDGTAVQFTSSLLELLDSIGSGSSFGVALEAQDGDFSFDRMQFRVAAKPYRTGSVQSITDWMLQVEDFSAPEFLKWSFHMPGIYSHWAIREGRLVLSRNANLQETFPTIDLISSVAVLESSRGLGDCRMDVRVQTETSGCAGVVFRYAEPDRGYRFRWDTHRQLRLLEKRVEGQWQVLAQDNEAMDAGREYVCSVEAVGDRLRTFLDGEPVFDVVDDTYLEGAVGLYGTVNQTCRFDDVAVQTIERRHGPQLTLPTHQSVTVGQVLHVPLSCQDEDGDPVSVKLENRPAHVLMNSENFYWVPSDDQVGAHTLVFVASDGLFKVRREMVVHVLQANQAPQLASIEDAAIPCGRMLTLQFAAEDADGDFVRFSLPQRPDGAMLLGNTLMWTPGESQVGTHELTVCAGDGRATVEATFRITVLAPQGAAASTPVFEPVDDRQMRVDALNWFQVRATDPDGDAVVYSLKEAPEGVLLLGEVCVWRPLASHVGEHEIVIEATDGSHVATMRVTVEVQP